MNADKLKALGLTPSQIQGVLTEHSRVLFNGHGVITHEKLEARRKREEIMAIEDTEVRQELIKENSELFTRRGE